MISSRIDFNVLEGNRRGATGKKQTDQRILDRYEVTDLKSTAKEQARIHIQQIQQFTEISICSFPL